MQLHQLKPVHKPKKPKRIGRGGKRGTYSGRGVKGQKARAGRKMKPIIRELIKKYPKLRGYRRRLNNREKRLRAVILNIGLLDKKFKAGERISPDRLIEKDLISRIKGKMPAVKILGRGKIGKPLTVENCQVSETARRAIEKAGGKVI